MIQERLGGICPPSDTIVKRCPNCGEVKPLSEFSGSKKKASYCRPCFASYMLERRKVQPVVHQIPEKKRCTFCGLTKPIHDFGINRAASDAHTSRCLDCLQAQRTGEAYRSKVNISNRKRWVKVTIYRVRGRCAKQGVPFDLTEDDITVPEFCPVLGIPLTIGLGIASPNTATLDRTRPELGYVKGNVAVMSWLANNRKGDCTDPAVFDAIAAYLRRK